MRISTMALQPWNTLMSGASSVAMYSVLHEGSLTFTFRAKLEAGSAVLYFCFRLPHSYTLMPRSDSSIGNCGKTLIEPRLRLQNVHSLINLELIGRYVTSLGNWSDDTADFDRYIFEADQVIIEVFSNEPPEVGIIGRCVISPYTV